MLSAQQATSDKVTQLTRLEDQIQRMKNDAEQRDVEIEELRQHLTLKSEAESEMHEQLEKLQVRIYTRVWFGVRSHVMSCHVMPCHHVASCLTSHVIYLN